MKSILKVLSGLIILFGISVWAQQTPQDQQPQDQPPAGDQQKQSVDQQNTKGDQQTPADQNQKPGPQNPADKPFLFGLGFASESIDGVPYLSIALQPELKLGKFGAGLDVTLRFDNQFNIYKADWTNWKAIVAKVKYLSWDVKGGSPVFVKIGLLDDVYLGHGSIFYRYSNKLFLPAIRRVGLQFDLNLVPFGWELFDDDILDNRIFGGRLYVRPFNKSGIFFLNKLAVGVSGAADIRLDKSISPSVEVDLAGADLDLPIFKLGEIFSLLLYTDFVKNFYFPDGGSGIMPGAVLTVFGFEFRGEYHIYQKHFNGAYFDAFYDLQRNTKLATLTALTNGAEGWSIKMSKAFGKVLGVGFDMGANRGENPDMHIEVNVKEKIANKIKGIIAYDHRDINTFADAWQMVSVNAILSAAIQYFPADKVMIQLMITKSFSLNPDGKTYTSYINTSIGTQLSF